MQSPITATALISFKYNVSLIHYMSSELQNYGTSTPIYLHVHLYIIYEQYM